GADPLGTTMTIVADGLAVDRSPIQVGAASHAEATFRVPANVEKVSVVLADREALAADDRVDMVGFARSELRVTIVSDASVSFDPEDPLLVGVDIAPLTVQQVVRAAPPSWASASVAAEDTPLILHGRFGDRRVVVFAFDPDKSNLPHLAAFPLLMANSVDWLTPGRQAVLHGGLGSKSNIQPRALADIPASSAAAVVP